MINKEFYNEQKTQSLIKCSIVSKYFAAWANVMKNNRYFDKIGYIDLYCGPGIYKDGSKSTPIYVAESCIADEKVAEKIIIMFNDCDPEHIEALKQNLRTIEGYEKIQKRVWFSSEKLTPEITEEYFNERMPPSFSFIDPIGYMGVTLKLIKNLITDWGSDCVLFFNYVRVNAAINNRQPEIEKHMQYLFGKENLEELRTLVSEEENPLKRESVVMNKLTSIYKKLGCYTLPFKFNKDDEDRTSHYLILLTKHTKGLEIMKQIMAKESSKSADGLPYFEYMPPTSPRNDLLYPYAFTYDDFKKYILVTFKGMQISANEIYEYILIETKYEIKNARKALQELEKEGKIKVISPDGKRRGNTIPPRMIIKFP